MKDKILNEIIENTKKLISYKTVKEKYNEFVEAHKYIKEQLIDFYIEEYMINNYQNLVISNTKEVFDVAQDKLSIMKSCAENDIPHPKTLFDIESADAVLETDIKFPVIMKPRRDCGARGMSFFENEADNGQ